MVMVETNYISPSNTATKKTKSLYHSKTGWIRMSSVVLTVTDEILISPVLECYILLWPLSFYKTLVSALSLSLLRLRERERELDNWKEKFIFGIF